MKFYLIIWTILLQSCTGYFALAQQIVIRSYTIEDGLVNNNILNIRQDKQGFIWICTLGGLSRYDGTRFSNYTVEKGLTNDMINDIYEIAPQEFLVAQNMKGPHLLNNSSILPLSSNNNVTINRFYTIGNKLLAATDDSGLVKFENNNFIPVNYEYKTAIHSLSVISDSVWIVLQQLYAIQLVTPSLQAFSTLTKLNATITFTDSHKRTWVGTSHGLRLLSPAIQNGKPIVFTDLPLAFDLPILRESYISDFLEDSQGNYWIGTGKGLVKVGQNGQSSIFTEQNGLPVSVINCIREDCQKNIWIGTTLGLARLSLINEVNTFAPKFGLSHDGTVFISPVTENKLQLFDGKNIRHLNLLTGKLTGSIFINSSGYKIYKLNKEQLLVIKGTHAMIYHAGEETAETISWPEEIQFDAIIRIDENNFLASKGNKLFNVSNGRYTEKFTFNLFNKALNLMRDKKNFLWLGTKDSGLIKLNITGKNHSYVLHTIDTIIKRLPDTHIRALFSDRENELWIGTRYKGLLRLIELPDGKYEIQNYGTQQGLCSDFVRTINRDNKGNIWAGTMQGIEKLIPEGNHYRVFNFGRMNKIFLQTFDITFLKDGYLVATGTYILHTRDIQQDTMPAPKVYITKIFTGSADSGTALYAINTRLPYNKAQIYFEFSSPQFTNEAFTEYSYRLYGSSDTSWAISGKSHSVYFASLQPGNYRFEVRAMGFNGKWGDITLHQFMVASPFWQKTWFIFIVFFLITLLVYLLYRYRIQQLIKLQRVRNRIATDLHDEIGSNLTNISILTSLSQKNLSETQQASQFLQRISEEVSSSSQALDDIIWSVNTSHDTLEETVARMRRYAAELFDAANIHYELYLDPDFEGRKLIMEQRRDVYLLYKEAVNNISKHAGAKNVSIQITIENNRLLLCIKDDGKGFETHISPGRHGLQGMKERVQKWKGEVNIESAVYKGTSIQISVPVST